MDFCTGRFWTQNFGPLGTGCLYSNRSHEIVLESYDSLSLKAKAVHSKVKQTYP